MWYIYNSCNSTFCTIVSKEIISFIKHCTKKFQTINYFYRFNIPWKCHPPFYLVIIFVMTRWPYWFLQIFASGWVIFIVIKYSFLCNRKFSDDGWKDIGFCIAILKGSGYQSCVGQSSIAITPSVLSLDVLVNAAPMRLKLYTEIIYYKTHICALRFTRAGTLPQRTHFPVGKLLKL